MWMYDDFGTDHRAQIKEKKEFKKNVLLPIRERYLRGNKWISDFFDSSNFRDQQDLENQYRAYGQDASVSITGLFLESVLKFPVYGVRQEMQVRITIFFQKPT